MKGRGRGQSLTEIMVSVAIISIVACSVTVVNRYPRQKALDMEDRMRAALSLERKLNQLRSRTVTSMATGTFSESHPSLNAGVLNWTITTPDTTRPDWKEVYLWMTYNDRAGKPRQVQLVSSLYEG